MLADIKLAMENYDHFTPNNLIAYKSGHHVGTATGIKSKTNRKTL
ncbi:hypothetical protein PGH46_00020 [Legionella pneumophila]|nr:hypothetical protein PGH46_00020 [Legionella pneumophila]